MMQLERKLSELHGELKKKLDTLHETRKSQGANTQVLKDQISDLVEVRRTLYEQQ